MERKGTKREKRTPEERASFFGDEDRDKDIDLGPSESVSRSVIDPRPSRLLPRPPLLSPGPNRGPGEPVRTLHPRPKRTTRVTGTGPERILGLPRTWDLPRVRGPSLCQSGDRRGTTVDLGTVTGEGLYGT